MSPQHVDFLGHICSNNQSNLRRDFLAATDTTVAAETKKGNKDATIFKMYKFIMDNIKM